VPQVFAQWLLPRPSCRRSSSALANEEQLRQNLGVGWNLSPGPRRPSWTLPVLRSSRIRTGTKRGFEERNPAPV